MRCEKHGETLLELTFLARKLQCLCDSNHLKCGYFVARGCLECAKRFGLCTLPHGSVHITHTHTHIKYSSLLIIHIRPPVCSIEHNHPAICVPRATAIFVARLHKLITVIHGISSICNFALPRRSCMTSHMLEVLQHCVLGSHLVFTGTSVNRQHVGLPERASQWCSEGCSWDRTEGNTRSSTLAVGLWLWCQLRHVPQTSIDLFLKFHLAIRSVAHIRRVECSVSGWLMVSELEGRSMKHPLSASLHCSRIVVEVLRETTIILSDDGWLPGDPEQEVALTSVGCDVWLRT